MQYDTSQPLIGTAHTACAAGSMKLSSVRPGPSVRPITAARSCGGFAAVDPARGRYRSIAARPALGGKCEQCHAVSGRRKRTQTCFRLTLVASHQNSYMRHPQVVISRCNDGVILARAWLLVGWVVVFGRETTSGYTQPLRPTLLLRCCCCCLTQTHGRADRQTYIHIYRQTQDRCLTLSFMDAKSGE